MLTTLDQELWIVQGGFPLDDKGFIVYPEAMRKRPWEIPTLTVLYLLAPLINLSFTCLARGYDLTAVPALFVALPWEQTAIYLCYPILAIAVWTVSLPGWWIFVALNLTILTHNVWVGVQVPGANPMMVVAAESINVALASLLFTRHARSPYFSPKIRWWNQPERFRLSEILEVPVTVRHGAVETQGHLLDVSANGCFVETNALLDMDGAVELDFECWGLTLHAKGLLVRHTYEEGGKVGHGVLFDADPALRKQLQVLVKVLKAHQVPVRA